MKVATTTQRINEIMREKNLKQIDIIKNSKKFCEDHNVKLTKVDLSQYVNGKTEPGAEKLTILSRVLDVDETWLMGYDVPKKVGNNVVTFQQSETKFISIDVLGSVPAGVPTEAMEDIVGQVEIPEEWTADGSEYRALRVKGDSMYPLYLEGDIVILRIQPDCHNGQDAVVYVNGYDATIKKVIKNDDGTTTLKAINPEWKSKTYGPHDEPIRIWGVVVKLERSYK